MNSWFEGSILLENEDCIAINKPVGIASIPERSAGLPNLFQVASEYSCQPLYIVHRLDKEVSGVIVFAKTHSAHRELNIQFEHRQIRKQYACIAHGVLDQPWGSIEKPIREFGSGRMGVDESGGKPSSTRFIRVSGNQLFTYCHAFPHTGRRHQIRVHFYSIGNPLVGDLRYGNQTIQATYPRLMLHAMAITIQLPSSGIRTIHAPIPLEFELFLQHHQLIDT